MTEHESDSPWDVLSRAATVECPACGARNPARTLECEACSEPLPEWEEEEAPVSVMMGEGLQADQQFQKIPLEQAENLLKLQRARDGILSGQMSKDDYRVAVAEVLRVARLAVEVFSSPAVENARNSLPPDQAAMIDRTKAETVRMLEGVERMMKYTESDDAGDAQQGYQLVYEAMVGMDKVQDEAMAHPDFDKPMEAPETP